MKPDKFWRSLWAISGIILLVCVAAGGSLFFFHIDSIDAAAVGVSFNSESDPFASPLKKAPAPSINGVVFKDALPLGLSHWSWDSIVNWHSSEEVFDGTSAIAATFTKEWAGFGISGFSVPTNRYHSLTLSWRTDVDVGEMYVELYDSSGVSLGRQPLSWYSAEGKITGGVWQTALIPLEHLTSSSTSVVTGISISTTRPGLVFVDAVRFSPDTTTHPIWEKPPEYIEPPFNPFATSTPQTLPYTLALGADPDQRWYTARGLFTQSFALATIGPIKNVANDALAYFRSGRAWSDYAFQASVDAGGQVFSLIVRMQDENNYVSCAFSYSGNTVQMYSVVNGVSTMVAQTEKLHYSDYTGGTLLAGALVHGKKVICAEDGKQVLSDEIDTIAPSGTIGLGFWDQSSDSRAHKINSLQVNALVGE